MNHYSSKYSIFILILFLIIAFGLRFYKIGEHGLAGDEKYSLFVSQFVTYEGNNQHDSVRKPNSPYFTPKEFWSSKTTADFFDSIARLDTGNGALYTYSLHFWSKLVGLDDGSLRLLSLLFNLLTITLLYLFVKEHFQSVNLALLVAFLATISPFYIIYSQVARNYCMNMFFALLATHLLLKIIQLEESVSTKKAIKYYIFYGLSALACEMCHFSTFPLFLIHGLFVLIYFRKIRGYIGLTLAMLIPLFGVLAWLKSDGGKWVFDYINNSVKVYNSMAQTHPDDYLSLANLKNIIGQMRHVVSSMFLLTDGLYLKLSGYKNTFGAAAAALFSMLIYQFVKSEKLKTGLNIGVFFIAFLLISSTKLSFLLFSVALLLLFFYVKSTIAMTDKKQQKLRVFLLLLSFIPLLSLVVFAYQDGNTFRIIPRYVGYSYAFNLTIIALIISDLCQSFSRVFTQNKVLIKDKLALMPPLLAAFFMAFLAIQLFFISGLIQNIWQDKSPRYFMQFVEPRTKNPYQLAAANIVRAYAKGDTIIYPSTFVEKKGGVAMPSYSVVDAQLTNFYLPKEADIIQRVEMNEANKIILKKVDGKESVIFDFQGNRFRY